MASQEVEQFHWHFTKLDDQNLEIRGRTLFLLLVLFSIVILVTLLFLYARWVCRLPGVSPNAPPLSPPHSQQPLHHQMTQGLDASIITGLPIILYQSALSTSVISESECCICLSLFEDGDKIKMLPECRHCYHAECVDRWLTAKSSCPLCRVPLHTVAPVPQIVTE